MARRFAILGAALFFSALWLFSYGLTAAQIERGPAPTRTPDTGPSPTPIPGATPTIDRLAPPPTAAVPSQADEGAQLYWLHCQPCHGDQGQGLTDEWRAQYPPEDQNCWESGCHGPRPYDQAFALPTSVPALIGPAVDRIMGMEGTQVLQKFETMGGVYRYARVSMPLFFPGDLEEEEYLAIMAHLARENGLWDGAPLTNDTIDNYRLSPPVATAAISTEGHLAQATFIPEMSPSAPARSGHGRAGVVGLGALGALLVLAGALLWRNRSR